jgi:hypothetical protein
MKFHSLLIVAATAWSLVGCGSVRQRLDRVAFDHRAAQSATFAALTPQQQDRLARGKVAPGDTRDMVWLALGEPDRVERIEHGERWMYEAYLNGGSAVTEATGPAGEFRLGKPTLITAVAFREGVVSGVMQRH